MNQLVLSGKIKSAESVSYTPAGIPVLRFWLIHHSSMMEAGKARNVSCEIECVVLGGLVNQLINLNADADYDFTGFLAAKNLKNPRPVFHVTQLDGLENLS